MTRPWGRYISAEDEQRYEKAGFGRNGAMGNKPALLIIDVQYRTTGTVSRPYLEAIEEFPTSCGEAGWAAIPNIGLLLKDFRENGWPVLYPYVAPKVLNQGGRLAEKVPEIMHIPARGYEFVAEIAPAPEDILIPKKHPSAFFGTALVSQLIDLQIDTLVLAGCTTSGCVRASAVDARSYNYHVMVPHDAVYDRGITSHAVSLFDMAQKYATVSSTLEALKALRSVSH